MRKKYDYIIFDINIMKFINNNPIEHMINILKNKCNVLIIDGNYNIDENKLLYNIMKNKDIFIIKDNKPKNNVVSKLTSIDKNVENVSELYIDLKNNNINTIKDIKNEFKKDIIISDKVSININKKLELDITKKEDCKKMMVKDIKKSKQYKAIPKKYKKSKMKKDELCDTIQEI